MARAKKSKNDEFYTRMQDIEEECNRYADQYRDQIIYCNCDDPIQSKFWEHFFQKYHIYGLAGLVSTHYCENGGAYKLEYWGEKGTEPLETPLKGTGDFREQECINILKGVDIVITNPPFSLFREYIAQLMRYKKKFLVLGNPNAVTYREVFPYFKEDSIRLGFRTWSKAMPFIVSDDYGEELKATRKTNVGYLDEDGKIYALVQALWFTNLDVAKRKETLFLHKGYTPEIYPTYDNYDAINVDKVADIPCNYSGVVGVPVTVLERHNPDQFEIIGLGNSTHNFTPSKVYTQSKMVGKDGDIRDSNIINSCLVLEVEDKPERCVYYLGDEGQYLKAPYARVLIRNKHPKPAHGSDHIYSSKADYLAKNTPTKEES